MKKNIVPPSLAKCAESLPATGMLPSTVIAADASSTPDASALAVPRAPTGSVKIVLLTLYKRHAETLPVTLSFNNFCSGGAISLLSSLLSCTSWAALTVSGGDTFGLNWETV